MEIIIKTFIHDSGSFDYAQDVGKMVSEVEPFMIHDYIYGRNEWKLQKSMSRKK